MPGTLYTSIHLILTTTPWEGYCDDHSHLQMEKLRLRALKQRVQGHAGVNGGVWIATRLSAVSACTVSQCLVCQSSWNWILSNLELELRIKRCCENPRGMWSWPPGGCWVSGSRNAEMAGWEAGDPSYDGVKHLVHYCLWQPRKWDCVCHLLGEVVEKGLNIGVGCYLTFLAEFHEKKIWPVYKRRWQVLELCQGRLCLLFLWPAA